MTGEAFDLDAFPPDELGPELARWMRGIDRAFLTADDADKVFGHIAALTTTMRLLQRLPGFDCDLIALRDLLGRLDKLSVGQKEQMRQLVDAIKTNGRPPDSTLDDAFKSMVVALIEVATTKGWARQDITRLVAKELARVGVKGRRGDSITDRAVDGWGHSIIANDDFYRQAERNFAELMPKALSGTQMKKFVRHIIEGRLNIRH